MTDHHINTECEDQDWEWGTRAGKTKDSLRTACAFMWIKTTVLWFAFWKWLFVLVLRKLIKPPQDHNPPLNTRLVPYMFLYYILLWADAIQIGKEHIQSASILVSILLAGCCFHPLKEKLKDILIKNKNSVSTNSREKKVSLTTENLFCFFLLWQHHQKRDYTRAETRHRLFRKQTRRQTSCVLLAVISAQRPDNQLATEPSESKGESLLVSDQVHFLTFSVHAYNS